MPLSNYPFTIIVLSCCFLFKCSLLVVAIILYTMAPLKDLVKDTTHSHPRRMLGGSC